MLNLIDQKPFKTGWGKVYQSGVIASLFHLDKMDKPYAVISMSGDENWITTPHLVTSMADNDTVTLSDTQLLAMVAAIIDYLTRGYNILIHCIEGKYRSTYMDVAVHMRIGMSFDDAFALVKERHPIADLRKGCSDQLHRLASVLSAGVLA